MLISLLKPPKYVTVQWHISLQWYLTDRDQVGPQILLMLCLYVLLFCIIYFHRVHPLPYTFQDMLGVIWL